MKKLLIVALLFAIQTNAQQITWQKYYKSSNSSNIILTMIELEDSGFIATTPVYQPIAATHTIRLDKYGDTLWVKKRIFGYGLY
jgi:hypothetical protein